MKNQKTVTIITTVMAILAFATIIAVASWLVSLGI